MQMMQWRDLTDELRDKILWFVGEYDWRLHFLMIVAKSWLKKRDGTTQYHQVGTIVLEPMEISREHFEPQFGKTFAAVASLIIHSQVHKISPDQYKYVQRPKDISSFQPITKQSFELLLQLMRNLGMERNGQRLRYKNVTTFDLTDNSNLAVDDTVWRSEEIALTDLLYPQIPLLPTNGGSFAAYLFLWFFPKVTSVNLSRTKWSGSATALITFSQIEQLIWRNCYITTASFLSPLLDCTKLVELQLDNSTFRLPYTEREQPWFWMDICEDGNLPYNIFQNLVNCNQLTKFSCANCRVEWYRVRDNFPLNLPITHPVPGHFCSQWLI